MDKFQKALILSVVGIVLIAIGYALGLLLSRNNWLVIIFQCAGLIIGVCSYVFYGARETFGILLTILKKGWKAGLFPYNLITLFFAAVIADMLLVLDIFIPIIPIVVVRLRTKR